MKLNEVIVRLVENPKNIYEVVDKDGFRKELSVSGGWLYFKRYNSSGELMDCESAAGGFSGNINLNHDWKLKLEPVDLITAANSGKKIKPIFDTKHGFNELCYWSMSLKNINSKWLIESKE